MHSSLPPSIHAIAHLPAHQPIHPFIQPSTHLPTRSFKHLLTHPPTRFFPSQTSKTRAVSLTLMEVRGKQNSHRLLGISVSAGRANYLHIHSSTYLCVPFSLSSSHLWPPLAGLEVTELLHFSWECYKGTRKWDLVYVDL